MSTIRLNGKDQLNNVTCFSFAPTILEVSSTSGGSKATAQIFFGDFSGMSADTEYYMTINDITLTAVTDIKYAKGGYNFYMKNSNVPTEQKLMVNSLAECLMRVPEVSSSFTVYVPAYEGNKQNNIIIQAYTNGNNTPLAITTNIPFATVTKTAGTSTSEIQDGHLKIDVFKVEPTMKYGSAPTSKVYKTTLAKKTQNDSRVRFDLAPLFASMTDEGDLSQFAIQIYQVTDTGLIEMGNFDNIYNVNGYLVNQGGEFIPRFNDAKVALNVNRGTNRNYLNNTLLYVYEPTIPLSVYTGKGISVLNYNIRYVDSSGNTILSKQETANVSKALTHFTVQLSENFIAESKYVDIEFTQYNLGTLRFNVIKPVNCMGDEYQRLYWYNSYGGVSFFDFSNRTEERKIKVSTYQDSVLNYYDDMTNERNMVYDKQNEISVTLLTHNIHKDGTWLLYDLQQSRSAWTYVNGEKYRVIVSDIEINTTSVTDIYTASVKYTYSMGLNV